MTHTRKIGVFPRATERSTRFVCGWSTFSVVFLLSRDDISAPLRQISRMAYTKRILPSNNNIKPLSTRPLCRRLTWATSDFLIHSTWRLNHATTQRLNITVIVNLRAVRDLQTSLLEINIFFEINMAKKSYKKDSEFCMFSSNKQVLNPDKNTVDVILERTINIIYHAKFSMH